MVLSKQQQLEVVKDLCAREEKDTNFKLVGNILQDIKYMLRPALSTSIAINGVTYFMCRLQYCNLQATGGVNINN